MIGYKAFDSNLMCRGFQYEIGKTYEFNGEIELCEAGFHFCENIADCFSYYSGKHARFAKVEALGNVVKSEFNSKCVTDKIRIIEEISMDDAIKMTNTGYENSGCRNTGDKNNGNENSGNRNSGNKNTGNWNSGNRNSGYENTGDGNTGNLNTGCMNSGDKNTGNLNTGDGNTGGLNAGDWNSGNRNSGNRNAGDWNVGSFNTGGLNVGDKNNGDGNFGNNNTGNNNTGNMNSGNENSGDRNSGDWNTGGFNSGNGNTGYRNTGNQNTGDWNKSSSNNGCFMTVKPTIMMFNKPSEWTIDDWHNSMACGIMNCCPDDYTDTSWIESSYMTDEEKEEHPEYKTTDGYLRVTKYKADKQKWWDELSDSYKQEVMSLPNFDPSIFYECTGIKVEYL